MIRIVNYKATFDSVSFHFVGKGPLFYKTHSHFIFCLRACLSRFCHSCRDYGCDQQTRVTDHATSVTIDHTLCSALPCGLEVMGKLDIYRYLLHFSLYCVKAKHSFAFRFGKVVTSILFCMSVCVCCAEFVESDGTFCKEGKVMYCDKLATWLIRALGSCFVCVCPVLSL